MENSFINKFEVPGRQVFQSGIKIKADNVPPSFSTQVQFLINRTDELRSVLKEIDETLKRIQEQSQNNFIKIKDYL